MPLIEALLKINITLGVCYLLFYLLLRKLTFYNLNRIFFLFTILLSACMPFINIRLEETTPVTSVPLNITSLYNLQTTLSQTFGFIDTLPFIFWAGVTLMVLRILIQLGAVGMLYRRSRKDILQGTSVRIIHNQGQPFSFFKSIFLLSGQRDSEDLPVIIAHEKVHVRQWHSIDTLLAECNKAFCWFNPFAWLMAKAMQQNLEFIADREVLKGTEARSYQYGLLRVSQPGKAIALANNFNFSHLKTRIIMMNKQQSGRIHLMKYLAAVPLVLALISCFGISLAQQKIIIVKPQSVPDKTTEKATLPATRLRQVESATTVEATKKRTDVHTTKNNKRVNKPTTPDHPVPAATAVSSALKMTGPVLRSGDNPETANKISERPVVVLNGKRIPYAAIEEINPDNIASVSIIKGDAAIRLYGQEGAHGAILITLKK